MIKIFLNG